MSRTLRAVACAGHLGGGMLLWSSCFVALYAVLSLGCEAGAAGWLRPGLVAAWVLHLAAIALLLGWQWARRPARSPDAPFGLPPALHAVAVAASALALLGTVWIGWPVLALPPCDGGELRTAQAIMELERTTCWTA